MILKRRGQRPGNWMRRCCSASLLESEVISVYLMRCCWMYSCPYKDIRDYPADVVLHYLRSINPLEMWRSRVFRVTPTDSPSPVRTYAQCSSRAQDAHQRHRSQPHHRRRVLRLHCASDEASAVASILGKDPEWKNEVNEVFRKIQYHPRVLLCTRTSL